MSANGAERMEYRECVCMPKLLHCPLSLSLKARRTRPISPLLHQGMTISRQCQWNWIRPNCPHPLSNTYRNRPLGNYTICITSLCPWCARHQLNCRCALKKCAMQQVSARASRWAIHQEHLKKRCKEESPEENELFLSFCSFVSWAYKLVPQAAYNRHVIFNKKQVSQTQQP